MKLNQKISTARGERDQTDMVVVVVGGWVG